MLMDIYVKSFNRPYFLDRCLYSIYKFATGKFRVNILDDGTPLKYVQKIQEKYPDVNFLFSDDAERKRKEIEDAVLSETDSFVKSVPVQFWRRMIVDGSRFFFLTEDDIWLTAPLDLDECVALMEKHSVNQIKVRWCGNENTNVGKREKMNEHIEAVVPNVHFMAEMLVKNRFYLHSIFLKLGLMKEHYFMQLYTYYDIGGVIYDKEFWLSLWPEDLNRIEEMIQLGKAAEWARKNPNTKFTKYITESARTTFLTSAAGAYNESTGFSMTMVNHYLNEEWFNDTFDIMENFPLNYSLETLYNIIQKSGDPRCDADKWKKWSIDFQQHFVSLGASPLG